MRRHLAPEDKAHLVLRFIKSKESASALCRKHRISTELITVGDRFLSGGHRCAESAFEVCNTRTGANAEHKCNIEPK